MHEIYVFKKISKSDNLMVILHPAKPYNNTVITIIKSTKLLTINCLKHNKQIINLPDTITIEMTNNNDDLSCSFYNLQQLTYFTNIITTKFLLQTEKLNGENILKPANKWIFDDNKMSGVYIIEHSCEKMPIIYYIDYMEKKNKRFV